MKNKKIIRIVCMITALFISATMMLTGCGGSKNTDENPGSTSQTSTAAGTQESAKPEPVTLKIAALVIGTAEANTIKTDPVAQYIKEKLGITMDFISDTSGDYKQWINVRLASNDLPDIFQYTESEGQPTELIKTGAVLVVDDLIAKSKTFTEDPVMKNAYEYCKKFVTMSDKGYAVPMFVGVISAIKNPVVGNMVRWDAYKKAGYPEVKSEDDLVAALKKMQEAVPKTTKGEKVYAAGGWFAEGQGWADWPFVNMNMWTEGSVFDTVRGGVWQYLSKVNLEENSVYLDPNSPYWRAVKFYNRLLREGLLDPESLTQKFDVYENKMKAGRYLYTNIGWTDGGYSPACVEAVGPDAGFVPLQPIADNYMLSSFNLGGERKMYISSSCTNPDRAMQLLDFACSQYGSLVFTNGVEGQTWDMVDGKPTIKDSIANDPKREEPAVQYKTGYNIYNHFVGYAPGQTLLQYNVLASLALAPEVLAKKVTVYEKECLEHFGVTSWLDYYQAKTKNLSSYAFTSNAIPVTDEKLTKISTDVQTQLFKNVFKVVLSKSDAELDKNIADVIKILKDNKIDDLINNVMSQQDKAVSDLEPFVKAVKDIYAK